jgi:hypothetical protein
MKSWSDEFVISKEECSNPEMYIYEILEPLKHQMKQKKIKHKVEKDRELRKYSYIADWKHYKLAVFNIV